MEGTGNLIGKVIFAREKCRLVRRSFEVLAREEGTSKQGGRSISSKKSADTRDGVEGFKRGCVNVILEKRGQINEKRGKLNVPQCPRRAGMYH